jgi:hypothetical protein
MKKVLLVFMISMYSCAPIVLKNPNASEYEKKAVAKQNVKRKQVNACVVVLAFIYGGVVLALNELY